MNVVKIALYAVVLGGFIISTTLGADEKAIKPDQRDEVPVNQTFRFKVGFPGCPAKPELDWTEATLAKLSKLGFNTIQLNLAWGYRPGDEPLNLEDVVDATTIPEEFRQKLPLRSKIDLASIEKRRERLRSRIELCRKAGLRSIFHFGAPYNMHGKFGDNPPNCLMAPKTLEAQKLYLEAFAKQFPGVDDILVYTYDQDAWLCSEFGDCPNCQGVPLHKRVSDFVNFLGGIWKKQNPQGRLWWEPWELSAGQVFKSIDLLDPNSIALALHANVAECMATMPVDRWLKISVRMAKERGIPVIVEYFLGGPTEEVETFTHLCWPAITLRGLQDIARLEPDGVKEYFGLLPDQEDPNLRMSSLFFKNPSIQPRDALAELAKPYGSCAKQMPEFWRLACDAMESFPWNASWYIRKIGLCKPEHGMETAFIRGQQAHTPSWESTRKAVFMKTDDRSSDPWMLEDVQLQCELCAGLLEKAIGLGEALQPPMPDSLKDDFGKTLADMRQWRRVALSYGFHIRESNLCTILRKNLEKKKPFSKDVLQELSEVLAKDAKNQSSPDECNKAIKALEESPENFLKTYFIDTGSAGWKASKGRFSMTSK